MYGVVRTSFQEKYYEVNPDIKKFANEQLDYWLGKFVWKFGRRKNLEECILLILPICTERCCPFTIIHSEDLTYYSDT